MKISFVRLLTKILIFGLIAFSLYGLLIQFIFSYLNQSRNGTQLTIVNFALPLLLTIVILLISGQQILFRNIKSKAHPFNITICIILTVIFCLLLIWQIWYVVTMYKMKSDLSLPHIVTELLPMVTGLCATLFLTILIGRRINAS
jgi:hypothetical protein